MPKKTKADLVKELDTCQAAAQMFEDRNKTLVARLDLLMSIPAIEKEISKVIHELTLASQKVRAIK